MSGTSYAKYSGAGGGGGSSITIGSPANGLSLVSNVLSLQLADTTHTGALSSTDWNTFNNKQPAGNYAFTDLSNLANPTAINRTLSVDTDNSYQLGTATRSWTNIHSWGLNLYDATARWFSANKSTEYLRVQASDSTPFTLPSGTTAISVMHNFIAPSATLSSTTLALSTTSGNSANPTGSLRFETGNNAGSGPSGDFIFQAGTSGGTRGNVLFNAQDVKSNSYTVNDGTNDLITFNNNSGQLFILVEDIAAADPFSLEGGITQDGSDGGTFQISANSAGSVGGNGGDLQLIGSDAQKAGNSGGNISVFIPAPSGGGTRGKFQLQTGSEGTVGHVWTSTDTSGSGHWAASTGGVTSVALVDSTNLFNVTGSPITTSGSLTLASFKSQAQHAFFAGPSGSAGAPTFRAIVASDVPTLNQSTTGGAATLTTPRNINGVAFDGSSNITIAAPAGTLTGTTLNSAVVTSSLTSIGSQAQNLDMNSHKVVNVTDPTSGQDAATKAYVDNVAAGINPAVAVQAATTAASDTSGLTYSNGVAGIGATLTGANNTALVVDGYTFTALGQRLLVKNDTQSPSGAFNGVYYVTQVQALALPLILTRALDYDTPADMNNTGVIPVINGATNSTTQWVLTSLITTVGTDPLTFTRFARNPADYLLKASNLSDVSNAATSFANITQPASAVLQGSVSTSAQVFAGEKTFNDALVGAQISTPSTPSAGLDKLYFKSDDNLYSLDSSGNERLVGPGMVGSDWMDGTSLFSFNGLGTITNNSVFYRQVGDTMEVRGSIYTGTPTASTAYLQLPSGLTIASTKMSSNVNGTQVGLSTGDSGASNALFDIIHATEMNQILFYDGSTNNKIFFAYRSGVTPEQLTKDNGSAIFISTQLLTFQFAVPITQWSANNGPGRSGFQFFASSQVTTDSSAVSSTSFTTFSNSPALTLTPTFSGTYKVYSTIPVENTSGASSESIVRVFNTSGSATLLYESQCGLFGASTIVSGQTVQSVYTLTAGTSYTFDIQAKGTGGGGSTIANGASTPFYMFAELCG